MKKGTKMDKNKIIKAVEQYLNVEKSTGEISRELDINPSTLQKWVKQYQMHGADWMLNKEKSKYPVWLKRSAVEDYLSGLGSLEDICLKYKIRTDSTLLKWTKWYNDHRDFNSSKGDVYMIKGRETEYEERVEIVAFCIAHNHDYHMACKKYEVSYQQVYAWVQKYKQNGADGLIDRRGKRKDTSLMSEKEKLSAQLKLLEAQNHQLQMENDYLKKLDELERGR